MKIFLSLALLLCTETFSQAFRHPGVVVSREQLEFVKQKIAAGEQPWKNAFDKMSSSSYASLTMKPSPRASVDCGAYSSPNNGCSEELNDAWSAYTDALMWYHTGKTAYADKAIEIMNAWSAALKTHTNHNAPLQSGWAASISVRAAEIIRYTYTGWAQADIDRFGTMLRTAYMPCLTADIPSYNGNWHLTMTDAALGIGVFLEDRAIFDKAVANWRVYVPAYFYITEDGKEPTLPPSYPKTLTSYWYGQTTFVDGLAQETCRDLGHTGYGIASTISAAETGLLQGLDLYAENEKRIVAGMEFHADYLLGKAVPSWLCGGKLDKVLMPTWEIGYNHFVNRRGMSLPLSKQLIESKLRPTGVSKHMAWETLTHADVGMVGIKTDAVAPQNRSMPSARPVAGSAGIARLRLGADGRLRIERGEGDAAESFGLNGGRIPSGVHASRSVSGFPGSSP